MIRVRGRFLIHGWGRRTRYSCLRSLIASARGSVPALIFSPLIRQLVSADSISERPSVGAVRNLVLTVPQATAFAILAMTPSHGLNHAEVDPIFEVVGKGMWSSRATRALISWSQRYPSAAISSAVVWLEDQGILNTHQARISLRIIANLAPFMSTDIASHMLIRIRPLALQRPDPYSFNANQIAQAATAALLAERPDLLESWPRETCVGVEEEIRRAIVIQAFSLGRTLTVRSHFGPMSHEFGDMPEKIVGVLRQIEDKYSISDQYFAMDRRVSRFSPSPHPTVPVAIGALLGAVSIIVAARTQLEIPGTILPVIDALLPLLGIIAAVHLLAIDLASGRMPRLATIVVATSPGILTAYGFIIASIIYSFVGTALWPLDTDSRRIWSSLTLLVSFMFLIPVVYELLRAQDVQAVARSLAHRNWMNVRRAASEYAAVVENNRSWRTAARSFKNIRQGFETPVARRFKPIVADRAGILRLDTAWFHDADAVLEEINVSRSEYSPRKHEIIILRIPGSLVSRGEPVAVIVTDEPSNLQSISAAVESGIRVNTRTTTVCTSDAVFALGKMLDATVRNSEQSVSQEIIGYINQIVEIGLAKIVSLEDELDATPFQPATAAILALEQIFRGVLSEGNEFMRETVTDALVNLGSLSVYYPSSWIVEAIAARVEVLAKDTFNTEAIKSVVFIWVKLGQIMVLAGQSSQGQLLSKRVGDVCVRLSAVAGRGEDAAFCTGRYAEMLAKAMYADYFAEQQVMEGVKKISEIVRNGIDASTQYEAAMYLLEIGAAALEHGRYVIAYEVIGEIKEAGLNFDQAVKSFRRPETARPFQLRSTLSGDVFGLDVEAAVIRYHDWVKTLKVRPGLAGEKVA
jgi:hypothetical protein